jgi:hypothetical protein
MRAPRGRYGEIEYGQYDQRAYGNRRSAAESWPRERMGMGIFGEQEYFSPANWGAGSSARYYEDLTDYGSPDPSWYAYGPEPQTRDYSPSRRPFMREMGASERSYERDRPYEDRSFHMHDFEHEFGHGGFTGMGPKGYKRTDDRIHEDICERLTRHPGIDASEIEIKVKNGEVTLSGHVHERRYKHMAENVVDSVSGVKEIHNELKVERHHEKSGRWFGEDADRSNGRYDEDAKDAMDKEQSRTTKSRTAVR